MAVLGQMFLILRKSGKECLYEGRETDLDSGHIVSGSHVRFLILHYERGLRLWDCYVRALARVEF